VKSGVAEVMKTTGWFRAIKLCSDRSAIDDHQIERVVRAPESRDLDENTILDLDVRGEICGITVEHATSRARLPQCSFKRVGA
jgi:uncharacterized protein YuzE